METEAIRNPIRRASSTGRTVLNGWLMMPGAFGAEVMAGQGFDALTIDLQHGLIDYPDMVAMLQSTRGADVPVLVRVPWLDPAAVMRSLDAGAWGVICPMIDTAEQAARLVSWVRYPLAGTRSMGPVRAALALGTDYAQWANEEILCLAMIETAEGFANMEEIIATPGIDGIYVGPADLTLALTGRSYRTGFDRDEPEMIEAIRSIADACRRQGKLAGLHCGGPAYAARAAGWGFGLVTMATDLRLLSAAGTDLCATRDLLESQTPVGGSCLPG